ncbi:N-acetylmuramidase family protein [Mucilaginibacter sp. 21P]|uniref:N-acetylmuramidase family protein n=1 Tax=Mucilaginibacter sp. 21P TaxID=2778902 RepID=UPI001C568601|nr:N-acetylmuramidase family protein [Mucilaginibacter sp. 21P]QXV65247.1 N-acetylmuramidase family protein [Mucilaginibacter sp. 21P]
MKKLSDQQLRELALAFGYDYSVLKALIIVESNQKGFSDTTGRIIIQFEPSWFKRLRSNRKTNNGNSIWQANSVGDQTAEWIAFNNAFALDPEAAMKSTSIGMMQIMGFHYSEIGFDSVGKMWDFAKVSEYNQVIITLKWINTVPQLKAALKTKNWQKVAYYYNGSAYKKFGYDTKLANAYKYLIDQNNG